MNQLRPVSELSAEAESILAGYPRRDGYLIQLFRVFANSQRFLKKGVANLLDRQSPLSLREREIVILRTCANNACEYEWGVHVTGFSAHAGLSEAQVRDTTSQTVDVSLWDERDLLLLNVVDELCEKGGLLAHRSAFESAWSLECQLEILALCGNYHTISFVANTAHLECEVFAARFPAWRHNP